jgi:hypothetical protein
VTGFLASDPYLVSEEDNPGRNEIFFHVRITRKPSPRWDSLVADCLHNYRSALDHTIWVLTERYGTANGHRTFPINLKQADYRKKLRRDVGETGRCGAKTIIERFQPYKAGNRETITRCGCYMNLTDSQNTEHWVNSSFGSCPMIWTFRAHLKHRA